MISERPFYARLLLAVYAIWFVLFESVGRYAAKLPTHDLTTALDRLIPVVPEAVWLYDFCFLLPLVVFLVVRDGHVLNRIALSILVATVTASAVYLAFPIAYPIPELGTSLSERFLALHYELDFRPGANKFPSLHVANAWMFWLAVRASRTGRAWEWAFFALAISISISTLLVKQHIVFDVVLGFAWAFPAWWIAGILYAPLARRGLGGADTVRSLLGLPLRTPRGRIEKPVVEP